MSQGPISQNILYFALPKKWGRELPYLLKLAHYHFVEVLIPTKEIDE